MASRISCGRSLISCGTGKRLSGAVMAWPRCYRYRWSPYVNVNVTSLPSHLCSGLRRQQSTHYTVTIVLLSLVHGLIRLSIDRHGGGHLAVVIAADQAERACDDTVL